VLEATGGAESEVSDASVSWAYLSGRMDGKKVKISRNKAQILLQFYTYRKST